MKWKAAPEGLESRNNTPRREIAAYRIQKWFLEPDGVLQLGLLPEEIDGVRERLHALIARVDAKEIPVF